MKYILLLMVALTLCVGCGDSEELYACDGIPEENISLSYMYFENEQTGYLLGTLTDVERVGSEFSVNYTETAKVFKTIDGGHHWENIMTVDSCSLSENAVYYNGNIFILTMNQDNNQRLLKFNLSSQKYNWFPVSIGALGKIWNSNQLITLEHASNANNKGMTMSIDEDLNIVDSTVFRYTLKSKPVFYKDKLYGIDGHQGLINFTDDKPIPMTISPGLIVEHNGQLQIAAVDNGTVSLASYDPNTNTTKITQTFKGYSIVKDFYANDQVITCLAGNISGMLTAYDLIYSLDKGATWKVRKLKEKYYVSPGYLINNVLYIYSGSKIQRIVLE